MMSRRAILGCLFSVATWDIFASGAGWAAETAQPLVIDELIEFTEPQTCTFAEPTQTLFNGILPRRTAGVVWLGQVIAPSHLRPALGKPEVRIRDNVREATLSVSGVWHGLHIVEIERWYRNDDQMLVDSSSIKFRESRGRVRKVLNRLGFELPSNGHSAPEGSGRYYNINLFTEKGLTVLNCQ